MDLIKLIVDNEDDWPYIWNAFDESLPARSNDDKNLYTINTIASNPERDVKQELNKTNESEPKPPTTEKNSTTSEQNSQSNKRGRPPYRGYRGSNFRGRGQFYQQPRTPRDDQQRPSQQMQRYTPTPKPANSERTEQNKTPRTNYFEQNRSGENVYRRGNTRPYRGNWNGRNANQNINSMESQYIEEYEEFHDMPPADYNPYPPYHPPQDQITNNIRPALTYTNQEQPAASGYQRQQHQPQQQLPKNGQTPTQMERPQSVGVLQTSYGQNNR